MDLLDDLGINHKEVKECKGQIYRLRKSVYIGKNGNIDEKISMLPLKRKSCPGCIRCGGITENLLEDLDDGLDIRPCIQDQGLYRMEVVDIGRDWETGIIDEWHLAFIRIEKE